MVIYYLHFEGVARFPSEADGPLLVDTDTVLPGPVTGQPLKAIRRRNSKVGKNFRPIHHPQFAKGHPLNAARKLRRADSTEKLFSLLAFE